MNSNTGSHKARSSAGDHLDVLLGRMWTKVDKTDGCWFWKGQTSGSGYGLIFFPNSKGERRRTISVHRLAYESVYGPVPDGLVVDHKCGERTCVNPDHLEAVTDYENRRRAYVAVAGFCPMGCGSTLFLGEGGFVTCSWIRCPNPAAAGDFLFPHAVVSEKPLWSWSCDLAGDVTLRIVEPLRFDLRVSRFDVGLMEEAGSPKMLEAQRRMVERGALVSESEET